MKKNQGWWKTQSAPFLLAGSQKVLWLKIGCISLNPTHEINPDHASIACGRKTFIWCQNLVQCISFHDWPSLSSLRCFHATVLLEQQRKWKKEKLVDVNKREVFQTTLNPLDFFIFPTADLDCSLSPLYTSHRWRNNSKDWLNFGFLLPLPVPLSGQWVKAVKLLSMAVLAEQAQMADLENSCRYYSWILQ